TPLRVKEAMRNAFEVVASGTTTLTKEQSWARVKITGLLYPKKLTCFYYASARTDSLDNYVYYTVRRELRGEEWEMYVYFRRINPAGTSKEDVTIDYVIVAWNMPEEWVPR